MAHSELGYRIIKACDRNHISMGRLADAIGLSRKGMSQIVTGKTLDPRLSTIKAIAIKTGVSLDWLAGLNGSP